MPHTREVCCGLLETKATALYVAQGNKMASRLALLCIYSASHGCRFLIEQPSLSACEIHPRLRELFELLEVGFWSENLARQCS